MKSPAPGCVYDLDRKMLRGDAAFYVWQVPGRDVTVYLRDSMMEWVAERVREAFQSVPRRGAETGGVLLGSLTERNGRPAILVEAAEEVGCEHRQGPSFQLSESDRRRRLEQMERLRVQGLVVVGSFRSDTRDRPPGERLAMEAADWESLQCANRSEPSLFLMIRPLSLSRILGSLLYCIEGRVDRETDPVPFPFASNVLAAAEPERERPAAPRTRRRTGLALAVAALVLLAGAFFGWQVYAPNPANTNSTVTTALDLTAERAEEALILHWDPLTASLVNAERADLRVTDGARLESFRLDRAQILAGAIRYTPVSGSVTFSLEARTPAGNSRGVLTVIDPSY